MPHPYARLTRFIKTEFKELIKNKNVLHLSKKSSSVLGKLYDLILKADKSFRSNQKHIHFENMELHLKQD